MAKLVNLRRARKDRARQERRDKAAAAEPVTRLDLSERKRLAAEKLRIERDHDGHRHED
ncbi:DUF4169 family protein [Halovulum sp. GXIMD14793]